ncbi:MgtC/SapB family protein [Emcibacter sp.]|uniref:MgtC/SapB family protein n=1 Tax=Emcibacter sp. TaxID=1979954 RepID=UPI003B637953
MNEAQLVFYHMGAALAIGLLIGIERGWEKREAAEGERIAGVRTYGLLGLLGGGTALLAAQFGSLVISLTFFAVAGVLTVVYAVNLNRGNDAGITSLVAGLLTFILGVLAAMGQVSIAASIAVVTVLILSHKPLLHRWVSTLEAVELQAGIKLLLISVVMLPVLPDRGYGPWQALNPYTIWWMVVLIAIISFAGYFAIKIGGARRGAVFTGLFGGLASSTAVTLHFSRMTRRNAAMAPVLGTGILLACGTTYVRIILVATILNASLFQALLFPTLVMAGLTYLPAFYYWRKYSDNNTGPVTALTNPLELWPAIGFGLLLAVVMVLGRATRDWVGEAGVLALAAAFGVADVDAITLSLARMSQFDLTPQIAVTGIVIAAVSNNLVKGAMAAVIGGRNIGLRVSVPLIASAAAGLLTTWLLVW